MSTHSAASDSAQCLPLLEPPEISVPREARDLDWPSGHSAELPTYFRHSGWKRYRQRVYLSLLRTSQSFARVQAFRTCGTHAYVIRSRTDPDKVRVAGSTCHDRMCVPCAKERSACIAGNVLDRIKDDPVRFLTLTIKAENEPLHDSIRRLTAAFSTLRRRRLWKNKTVGGVAFLEVHYSRNGSRWHPHLHILTQGRFINRSELVAAWHQITGDSKVVDIRLIDNARLLTRYVTKYASKPLDASFIDDDALLDEAVRALKGKRLCITFGTWQGVQLTEPLTDDEWENLGSLDGLVRRAANGDTESMEILRLLASSQADDLLEIARRTRPPPSQKPPPIRQLTLFS